MIYTLIIAFAFLSLTAQAVVEDRIVAKTRNYLVIVRIEDDTGGAMLVKVGANGQKENLGWR